jgi:SnoaL-like protein
MRTGLRSGTGDGFAEAWVRAWSSHDLDEIMAFYADGVVLVSPTAAALLGEPTGEVRGRAALREYFRKGLEAYPNLRFELVEVIWGLASVVVCFLNQRGTKTAEFMEFDSAGKVTRVVAHYSG